MCVLVSIRMRCLYTGFISSRKVSLKRENVKVKFLFFQHTLPSLRFKEERPGELKDVPSPMQFPLQISFAKEVAKTGSEEFSSLTCEELLACLSDLVQSLQGKFLWMNQALKMTEPVAETHRNYHTESKWTEEQRKVWKKFKNMDKWAHCNFASSLNLAAPSLVRKCETIGTMGRRGEAMTYCALTSNDATLIAVFEEFLMLNECVHCVNMTMRCQDGMEIFDACSSVDHLRMELQSRGLVASRINRWTRQKKTPPSIIV